METIKIHIQKIAGNEDIPLPAYMTGQAAGMDIFAAVCRDETILPGERKKSRPASPWPCPKGMKRKSGRAAVWRFIRASRF